MRLRQILGMGWSAALLVGNPAHADPACTYDQMQVDPASVFAPCGQIIGDQSLPATQRADGFFVRAHAYARTGKITLAAQDYDVAIKLDPNQAKYYAGRSSTEYKMGHQQDGWNDLNRALTLDPRNAQVLRAEGAIYGDAGDTDEALRLYTRALEIDPSEPYALLFRSKLYEGRHELDKAFADASALVALPTATINKLGYVDERGILISFHAVALDRRGYLFNMIGNHEAADEDFDAAVAEQRSARTLAARAEHMLARLKSVEALTDLDEAIRLDDNSIGLHLSRGMALAGLKRFDDALVSFDRALALMKINGASSSYQFGFAQLYRARMLRGLGRTDEAVVSLQTAVAADPQVRAYTLMALVRGGYWEDADDPDRKPPRFHDALHACMIDTDCN